MSLEKLADLSVEENEVDNPERLLNKKIGKKALEESTEENDTLEKAPEGYLAAKAFAKKIRISQPTIESKIQELGIERVKYKSKTGNLREFLSPEQQQQIVDSLGQLISAEEAPEGYFTVPAFAKKLGIDWTVVTNKIQELGIERTKYKNDIGHLCEFLSPEQQVFITESLEDNSSGTSIPENAIAFYLKRAGKRIKQGFRPDWLKNPKTGRNLEVDVFVDPPGIGIEYDGCFYHQDIERDMKKDNIAQENGYQIIHIRENGCPEMPEGLYNIKRKNNNDDTDLGECIKSCFEILDIPVPDIDVTRDKKEIMAFMRQRVLDKLDSARTFEELSVAS